MTTQLIDNYVSLIYQLEHNDNCFVVFKVRLVTFKLRLAKGKIVNIAGFTQKVYCRKRKEEMRTNKNAACWKVLLRNAFIFEYRTHTSVVLKRQKVRGIKDQFYTLQQLIYQGIIYKVQVQ